MKDEWNKDMADIKKSVEKVLVCPDCNGLQGFNITAEDMAAMAAE